MGKPWENHGKTGGKWKKPWSFRWKTTVVLQLKTQGFFQTGTDEHNGFTVSKVGHGHGIVEADFVAQW